MYMQYASAHVCFRTVTLKRDSTMWIPVGDDSLFMGNYVLVCIQVCICKRSRVP